MVRSCGGCRRHSLYYSRKQRGATVRIVFHVVYLAHGGAVTYTVQGDIEKAMAHAREVLCAEYVHSLYKKTHARALVALLIAEDGSGSPDRSARA